MTKDSDQTSSQADFLVNLSVSQEKENLRKMTEISGRKLLELSKSPDPLGLLEKMLMESLNSISTPYLRTWKIQTTPQGALIFQLRASVRTTKDKESGLLPTPQHQDHKHHPKNAETRVKNKKQLQLPHAVGLAERKMYPTPLSSDWKNMDTAKQISLSSEVKKLYSTPTTQDAKNNANPSQMKRKIKPLNAVIGGRLSANFTEYLMGFQQDWTKIEPTGSKDSETQSAHQSYFTSDKP